MTMVINGSGTVTGLSAGGLPDATITQADLAANVAGTGPLFYATQSTSITPSSNTATKITINTIGYDTNSNFITATNRFQPTVAGYYQINGSVYCLGATNTSLADVTILKNGSLIIQGALFYSAVSTITAFTSTAAGIVYLNGSTDYVELYGRVIGTGALSLSRGEFSGALIRGA